MKRSERRLLEEKLRYVAMEDIELDPERERQMLEEAKMKFMQQRTETDTAQTSGRHKVGCRVLIVSAAAVLLLALSFGFSVLMPESVSHAKGFVRIAAIWVNDTLHLGYEFDEPTVTPVPYDGEDVTYTTLEEAAANIPYPLVYLDDPSLTLRSVAVEQTEISSRVVISYGNESEYCRISLIPVAGAALSTFGDVSQAHIPWQCGELVCWEIDSAKYALTYYSNMEITVIGPDIAYEDFLALCQLLKPIN